MAQAYPPALCSKKYIGEIFMTSPMLAELRFTITQSEAFPTICYWLMNQELQVLIQITESHLFAVAREKSSSMYEERRVEIATMYHRLAEVYNNLKRDIGVDIFYINATTIIKAENPLDIQRREQLAVEAAHVQIRKLKIIFEQSFNKLPLFSMSHDYTAYGLRGMKICLGSEDDGVKIWSNDAYAFILGMDIDAPSSPNLRSINIVLKKDSIHQYLWTLNCKIESKDLEVERYLRKYLTIDKKADMRSDAEFFITEDMVLILGEYTESLKAIVEKLREQIHRYALYRSAKVEFAFINKSSALERVAQCFFFLKVAKVVNIYENMRLYWRSSSTSVFCQGIRSPHLMFCDLRERSNRDVEAEDFEITT